jgi:hypothetical protein
MIIAETQEAAKAENGIRDFPAHLLDHHPFDRSDLVAVGAVDGGTFDLVTADQTGCLACFGYHEFGPSSRMVLTENSLRQPVVPSRVSIVIAKAGQT